jgi:hypothetical protein
MYDFNMDKQIADQLYEIRHRDISTYTIADRNFLRARAFYLGDRDQVKYADIINSDPEVEKPVKVSKKEMARLAHPDAI